MVEIPKLRYGVPESAIISADKTAEILLVRAKHMFAKARLEEQVEAVFRDQLHSLTRYTVTDFNNPTIKRSGGRLYGVIAAITQLFDEDESGPATIVFAKPVERLIEVYGRTFKEAFSSDEIGVTKRLRELLLRAKENPGEIVHPNDSRRLPAIRGYNFSLVISEPPRLGKTPRALKNY